MRDRESLGTWMLEAEISSIVSAVETVAGGI
jgi:hypothetical protein